MYLYINALIMALLLPANGVSTADVAPNCRAELKGFDLLTVVELPTGIAVEGPWRVTHQGGEDGDAQFTVVATLDHVVETDALTGVRNVIPFPEPVKLAFQGETQEDLVRRAARMWCVTVLRAQENQSLDHLSEPVQTRITALPRAIDVG